MIWQGPLEVFAGVNRILAELPPYEIEIRSSESSRTIAGECGLSLISQGHYRDLTTPVDTLIVLGGIVSHTKRDPAFLRWLEGIARHTRRLASVCIGAFFLAEAGLLDGK